MKLKVVILVLLSLFISYIPALAGLSKTEVSQLYVSIFGRASEGEGNGYWQSQPDMAKAAAAMLDTDAARNYFGANLNTNQAFIEHIYLNTLNKTIADDFDGISYWVDMLDSGTSRGQAVATLVGAINDYAPDGPYYNPDDAATVAAYNQFMNRVEVSNYMADNVHTTPDDWETSTSFSHGMVVTDDPATVFSAMTIVNGFTPGLCGAYVAPGVWKEFDCYNLAAIGKTTNDDPFTPSWRLIGGYWQWGRKGPDPNGWHNTNTEHFAHGPTGPDAEDSNDGRIDEWDGLYAINGSWSDTKKTVNDPCPTGYRIPTKSQWDGVIENNAQRDVGTWISYGAYDTNYTSALFFGSALMLPAAGWRNSGSATVVSRGTYGLYWSSSERSSGGLYAGSLFLKYYSASTYERQTRRDGLSIRCIAE
jgi:uncharacterized protein (TIGR02145 family)